MFMHTEVSHIMVDQKDLDVDTVESEGILKINAGRKRENNEKMKRYGLMSRVMKWKLLEKMEIWTLHSLHSIF